MYLNCSTGLYTWRFEAKINYIRSDYAPQLQKHRLSSFLLHRAVLDFELIQTQMTQKPMLRAEVGMRVQCTNKASADRFRRERGIGQIPRKICKKRGICVHRAIYGSRRRMVRLPASRRLPSVIVSPALCISTSRVRSKSRLCSGLDSHVSEFGGGVVIVSVQLYLLFCLASPIILLSISTPIVRISKLRT